MGAPPGCRARSKEAGRSLKLELRVREIALADLIEIASSYDSPASEQFLDEARKTLERIARFPEIGRRRRFRSPLLRGVRSFRVRRFSKILVFYIPGPEAIDVIRVLHGARDLVTLLG